MHASSSQSVSFYVERTTMTFEGDSNHAQAFREPKLVHGVVWWPPSMVSFSPKLNVSKGKKLNGVA